MSKFRQTVKPTFTFNESEFPNLHTESENNLTKKDETISVKPLFTNIVSSQNQQEADSFGLDLARGWIGMYKDSNGETVYTNDYDPTKSDSEEELTPRRIIKNIELNSERFKQQFIELNGIDEYDKIYVNYQQYDSSSEEELVDEIVSDDQMDFGSEDDRDEY